MSRFSENYSRCQVNVQLLDYDTSEFLVNNIFDI